METGDLYSPIESLDPELEAQAVQRLADAVKGCQEEGLPLTFANVVKSAILQDTLLERLDRAYCLFSQLYNEEVLYKFIEDHAVRFGIRLFEGEVAQYLDIEPGKYTSHNFKESIGYCLIVQLPGTWQKITAARAKASFTRLDKCERIIVGIVKIDGRLIVVKLTNSDEEEEIAVHLGKKGHTPLVYESTEEVIAEEYIQGVPITESRGDPAFVGRSVARVLGNIHGEGIVYGNRVLDHVLIGDDRSRPRIIDLEDAEYGTDFGVDYARARKELRTLYWGMPGAQHIALREVPWEFDQ